MQSATIARGTPGLTALARHWRDWVTEPVLSVLFPPRCVGCGDFESHLCDSCRAAFDLIGPGSCPRCGEPGPVALVCGRCARCLDKEAHYSAARGAFRHEGPARRLVSDFKFGGQPVLGGIMAALALPAFTDFVSSLAFPSTLLATWVPSHRAAQRERGYNQAEVLARALVSLCPADVRPIGPAPLVCKPRATQHQKGLGRAGRQGNLRGAFALDKRAAASLAQGLDGIVLVDDVYTTGATAEEAASVLVEGTALPVYVFTFSRAVASSAERHD
jgi:predicted amidophosphoribosyltransferase